MTEQEAFEEWLAFHCPSGDADAVQQQWLLSVEYAHWEEMCWSGSWGAAE